MDQIKTGKIIRTARLRQNLTQSELGEKIGVTDKAASKWERGCGAPEVFLVSALAEVLSLDAKAILSGNLEEKSASCGNLLFSTEGAGISCCGKKLFPLCAKSPSPADALSVKCDGNELYITSEHKISRKHYISFYILSTKCFFSAHFYFQKGIDKLISISYNTNEH